MSILRCQRPVQLAGTVGENWAVGSNFIDLGVWGLRDKRDICRNRPEAMPETSPVIGGGFYTDQGKEYIRNGHSEEALIHEGTYL